MYLYRDDFSVVGTSIAMALIEEEPKYSPKVLMYVGIPIFVITIVISLLVHRGAHAFTNRYVCGTDGRKSSSTESITKGLSDRSECPAASVAGILATSILAIASFALFNHYPRNLFAASMAFVNASARIPDTFILLLQSILRRRDHVVVDEGTALQLLHLSDPTASMVILGFYLLTMIFLTLFIIHDTHMLPRKWIVAAALLASSVPLQQLTWSLITPVL